MDAEILKTVSQVAGIGGIAIGVLLLVFREVIRKNIFPSLKKDHAFGLLRLIVILTWSVAVIGVIGWVFLEYSAGYKDKGKVSLSQINIGKSSKGRFMEAIVNNTTKQNVVLSKLIYSRGVSSAEMSAIPQCCLYCMQAWYAVQKGAVKVSTPGSRLTQSVCFLRIGGEDRLYTGRLHYAPGCYGLLFAQLELNISVVASANSVTKVGVIWPNDKEKEQRDEAQTGGKQNYESNELLAEKDTVCIFLGVEHDAMKYKLCRPYNEFGELFL